MQPTLYRRLCAAAVAAEGSGAAAVARMRRARVIAGIGHSLPWAIAVVYFFAAPSDLDFGTQVIIWILFAMSLDLALGYAGILTLGQAAFFGLGAYTAGLFAIHLSPDPLLGHLVAIGVSALTGAMILHTSGITLLMLTLAIVSVLSQYANQATDLTGGDNGLQGIRLDPIFGVFEFNIFGVTAYFYALVVLCGWFVLAWRIVHSPFGRSLAGIRQNPHRMRADGSTATLFEPDTRAGRFRPPPCPAAAAGADQPLAPVQKLPLPHGSPQDRSRAPRAEYWAPPPEPLPSVRRTPPAARDRARSE
jgi:Branched-chain amino acid transport system / permease component